MMEWVLEHVHVYTGTPWWVSIILTAVAVRVVLFKPYIDAADNAAKLTAITPITKPIQAKMTAASSEGNSDEMMKQRAELQLIYRRADIKIWKSLIPFSNAITGFGTFIILRAMAKLPVPGLETGGILWFYNLSIPDPLFILPLATAGMLHWVLRVCKPLSLQLVLQLIESRQEVRWEPRTSLPQ